MFKSANKVKGKAVVKAPKKFTPPAKKAPFKWKAPFKK